MIAEAFIAACLAELDAPKPGNVHVFSDGHRMIAEDFRRSAGAAAGPLCRRGATVGRRILGAIVATQGAVGMNTNLGIVLLCAPLAKAAEQGADLRSALRRTLRKLTRDDAERAFLAIALAAPAGLGEAGTHDVHRPADCTLRQAMAAAAPRDRIARAFVTDFDDVFGLGLAMLGAAAAEGGPAWWPATMVYLGFLRAFPDSHILRKHGPRVAEETMRQAQAFSIVPDAGALPRLLAFDADLKARGINPGTSADLTVATLFAAKLSNALRERPESG